MLERFDYEATSTIQRAQDEAVQLNHESIGTEHILLALLNDRHIVDLLVRTGMTETDVRVAVQQSVPRGPLRVLDESLPQSTHSRDALECTLEETDGFGHMMVRNGHLLLGVMKESEGVGGRVLESLGGTLDGMRHEVLELLAEIDDNELGAA